MYRIGLSILAICSLLVFAAPAADIDGKWEVDLKYPEGKQPPMAVKITLDLKADGSALKGTMTMAGERGTRGVDIEEGTIEGSKFSFNTTQKTKKGEFKNTWEGTVAGNELKGTRKGAMGGRGIEFTAKKM